jgi:intein/homing endonuclease
MAAAYSRRELVGWAGVTRPELLREQFLLISSGRSVIRPALTVPGPLGQASGKKVMLYDVVRKVLGKDTDNYAQEIGDCLVAGTMVTMADGTEKRIEEVKIGDLVVTHRSRVRAVTRTVKKRYCGELVTVRGKGHPESVTATADHQFLTVPFQHHRYKHDAKRWVPVGSLGGDDRLVVPFGLDNDGPAEVVCVYGESVSHKPPRRFVPFDADMARLVGLYLAEGRVSSNARGHCRLEFSFSKNELELAREAVELIDKVFSVEARVVRLPSKPSVLLVRCNNADLARFFKRLIPGNVYDKEIPPVVFRGSREVRLEVLRGWLDGDGCYTSQGRAVGVSCSRRLASGMHRLARSCGLRPMFNERKRAPRRRVNSNQVCPYGGNGDECPRAMRDVGDGHRAVAVAEVAREAVTDVWVYCLEVCEDHSFIANGYAVHNCVSFGAKNATEYLQCCQILMGGQSLAWRPVFPPYYYGTGRTYVGKGQIGNEDGSLGSWMAEAVQRYGTLYSDEQGVPRYSGQVAKRWGDTNPRDDLDKWKDVGQKYPVRSASLIRSWDDLVTAIANGYPCTTASNVGYSMEAGRDGFHKQNASWGHQMCFIGVDDNDKDPYAIILNSWADAHGRLKDFDTGEDLPIGVLRVRRKDAEKHIAAGETFAFSQHDGTPGQDISKALFKLGGL